MLGARLGRPLKRRLDRPVCAELHPARNLAALTLDRKRRGEASLAGGVDQRSDPLERRLGRQQRAVAVVAQDAEQAPHLGQRVTAGLLDHRKRRAGALAIRAAVDAGEHRRDRLGLDDHRADPVGDHRLQLGGDPAALELDSALSFDSALLGRLGRLGPKLRLQPGAVGETAADEERREHEQDGERQVADLEAGLAEGERRAEAQAQDQPRGNHPAPGGVAAGRVPEPDQDDERQRRGLEEEACPAVTARVRPPRTR